MVLATKIHKLCEKIGFDGAFDGKNRCLKGAERAYGAASFVLKEVAFWRKKQTKKTYRPRKNSTIAYMFSVGVRLVGPLIYSC
ncbi:MAG: hypothetical protein D8B50_08060 [Prevotella sp.]|nr:MAG: hypothetical protein D8B50_08060 [Prevotella sp.]